MPSSDVLAHCVERVLIVTGASRGIGASTAVLAAQDGFKVCVNFCKQKQRAESVVRQIADAGGHAISVQADVTDEAEVIKMFETVDRELGPVTALVNNAGINHIAQGRIDSCTQEELKKLFTIKEKPRRKQSSAALEPPTANKKVTLLDLKRSNQINIALAKFRCPNVNEAVVTALRRAGRCDSPTV